MPRGTGSLRLQQQQFDCNRPHHRKNKILNKFLQKFYKRDQSQRKRELEKQGKRERENKKQDAEREGSEAREQRQLTTSKSKWRWHM